MAFNSLDEVENRLGNPAALTAQEVRELLPWMNQITEAGMRRLHAQLALHNLEAAQKFEQTSGRLTKSLLALVAVLVLLAVALGYSILIFVPGHSEKAAKESPGGSEQSEALRAPSGKKTLGPWKVKLSLPGSAEVPEKGPILRWTFDEATGAGFGYLAVTAVNLSDRSYSVRYSIYGYDQDGRRVSEGSDDFSIGKRESVLRKIFLVSQQSAQRELGSVFWIQVTLEE